MSIIDEIRCDIMEAIDAITEQDQECAAYLREHLVFDDERSTVMYTGDPDMVKMTPVPAAN